MNPVKRAEYCIRIMQENKSYKGEKIGIVKTNFYGEAGGAYNKGTIVLFKEFNSGRLVVELAHSKEDIEKNRAAGSFIATYGTIFHVPKGFVKEIGLADRVRTLFNHLVQ